MSDDTRLSLEFTAQPVRMHGSRRHRQQDSCNTKFQADRRPSHPLLWRGHGELACHMILGECTHLTLTGPTLLPRVARGEAVAVVRGGAGQAAALVVRSRSTRLLTVLGSVTGMKHMPAGAFSPVPMTISFSRLDRTFQPSACVQNRARPGRSRASATMWRSRTP